MYFQEKIARQNTTIIKKTFHLLFSNFHFPFVFCLSSDTYPSVNINKIEAKISEKRVSSINIIDYGTNKNNIFEFWFTKQRFPKYFWALHIIVWTSKSWQNQYMYIFILFIFYINEFNSKLTLLNNSVRNIEIRYVI